MKKRIVSILLVAAMSVSLFACGSKESSSSSDDSKKDSSASTSTHMNASDADGIEDKDITWAKDNSGNTFLAIAEDKGWIDDLGIKIDEPNFDETNAALTALAGGQVDIISNYGTNAPLQEIASGEDWLIIGGYMAQGCMPIVAKKGTKWNGVEDFIGKKVAAYSAANPDKKIIRLGIGDVTQPIAPSIIEATHKAVEEMGHAETFHGYAPDLGYEFLRSAIAKEYKDRGCHVSTKYLFLTVRSVIVEIFRKSLRQTVLLLYVTLFTLYMLTVMLWQDALAFTIQRPRHGAMLFTCRVHRKTISHRHCQKRHQI